MPTLRRLVAAALVLPLALVGAVPILGDDTPSNDLAGVDGTVPDLDTDPANVASPPDADVGSSTSTTMFPEITEPPSPEHSHVYSTSTLLMSSSSVEQVIIEPTDAAESVINTYPPRDMEKSPEAIVPELRVKLMYAALDNPNEDSKGTIAMHLEMGMPTIVLEAIEGLGRVSCDDGNVYATFRDYEMYKKVLKSWKKIPNFVLITNHGGECDTDNQRGFYTTATLSDDDDDESDDGNDFKPTDSSDQKKPEYVTGNPKLLTIKIAVTKAQISQVVRAFEMDFDTVPAGEVRRRFVGWNNKDPEGAKHLASLAVAKALDLENMLYSDENYISIIANEAHFATSISFSGKLAYNFMTLSLDELYMDIDVSFDAKLNLTADLRREFTHMMEYSPAELFFSMVSIPGILEIGPGVRFSIGTEVKAGAAVNISTALGFSVPNGKIHLDFLDMSQTSASGWSKPDYHSSSSISERLNANISPSLELAIELSANLMYGLINLSTGIKITPQVVNSFEVLTPAEEAKPKQIKGSDESIPVKAMVPYKGSRKNRLRKTKSRKGGRGGKAENARLATLVGHTGDIVDDTDEDKSKYDCGTDLSNGVALKSSLVLEMTAHAAELWTTNILTLERPMIERCWPVPSLKGIKPSKEIEAW